MNLAKISLEIIILKVGLFLVTGCNTRNYSNTINLERTPFIDPDYSDVTIPYNIAPLNFCIREEGEHFLVSVNSSDGMQLSIKASGGIIRFPLKKWKKLLDSNKKKKIRIVVFREDKDGRFKKYDPFFMTVANEPIDPYLCYRLLYPGFESGGEMKIVQRSVEDFQEFSVVENQLLDNNCVNCHCFRQNNPEKFLLHIRGSMGGTYFVNNREVTRMDLRVGAMTSNAVYPSWHPSGKYVVFSSNKIIQAFHMMPDKRNEIYDFNSSLVLYSTENNKISVCSEKDTNSYLETFPFWSPTGDYLYYCRTKQLQKYFDYKNIRYDLVRKPFDQATGSFGRTEVIFNARAMNKSVSVPSVSPDGQYLIFVLHDYGTASIWHKEADLYLLNLQNREVDKMRVNSDETESYQSWASNSKWIVFSSKRRDGLTARPYIAYLGSPENVGKPFILPQKDPTIYDRIEKTFNKPEFITGRINAGPRGFARASQKKPLKALWTDVENLND